MSFETLQAIILGIIQGITEWLPVSSQGIISLIMINFFGKSFSDSLFFSLWLHLGTFLAAAFYFRKDLINIFSSKIKKKGVERNTFVFLIITTIFSGLIALPLLFFGIDQLEVSIKGAMVIIGFLLIITGVLSKLSKNKKSLKTFPTKVDAIFSGISQGLAILPGISRSGITTSVLLFRKLDSKQALRFSFLMSLPVVLIGEIVLGLSGKIVFDVNSFIAILFSFSFGLLTISSLMKIARKVDFSYFVILIGLLSILSFFF